jgi:hypothetical protein
MIDGKPLFMALLRQPTVLASLLRAAKDELTNLVVHSASGGRRMLPKTQTSLRFQEGENVPDENKAFELAPLIRGERSLVGDAGQFRHAPMVRLGVSKLQDPRSRFGRERWVGRINQAIEHVGFSNDCHN